MANAKTKSITTKKIVIYGICGHSSFWGTWDEEERVFGTVLLIPVVVLAKFPGYQMGVPRYTGFYCDNKAVKNRYYRFLVRNGDYTSLKEMIKFWTEKDGAFHKIHVKKKFVANVTTKSDNQPNPVEVRLEEISRNRFLKDPAVFERLETKSKSTVIYKLDKKMLVKEPWIC